MISKMNFSQSLELGDSTFMRLESEVNHAINGENPLQTKDLEVILESPTLKSQKGAVLSSTRNRSRNLAANTVNYNNEGCTNSPTIMRSKSDSMLPKVITQNNLENYSKFFESDFFFQQENMHFGQSKLLHNMLSAPQKEIPLHVDENVDFERVPNDLDNSFEKPIFSEDLEGLLETEEHESSLPISYVDKNLDEEDEILHEISDFMCPPMDNIILRNKLLSRELKESYIILKEHQTLEHLPESNISLSCLSADHIELTEVTSSVPKEQKETETNKTELKCGQDRTFKIESKKNISNLSALKSMKAWNLPLSILTEYERKGINNMFEWQIQCLSNPKILFELCNLVYSAPTSAGKTLVSEILLLKTVIERRKKVLFILPFISVVREKMLHLQDLCNGIGYRVEGFFGGYTPAGDFDSINVAVCTIEKANSIVNNLLEKGKLHEVGTVIVDEVHLISDPARGYILELLLTKILYMSQKYGVQIQIIAMSATLSNVELLSKWLHAEMYITDFRPVTLKEMIKIDNKIYDNSLNPLRSIAETSANIEESFPLLQNDSDHVAQLCIETLVEGCSVIVFCPSKDWCETLARQLAAAIQSLGKQGGAWGTKLKEYINRQSIDNVKQQLRDIPTGLDAVLEKCITYGCSFHHAGLTIEERSIVETSFRSGFLKVIVATSTLSSGVNLPARRILIRSPLFGGKPMCSLTYRQMIGRAGRTGKDTLGESILICTERNARVGKDLINAGLRPLSSCLGFDNSSHLKRALLEVISSGVAITKKDIDTFVDCTLFVVQKPSTIDETKDSKNEQNIKKSVDESLDFLIEYEFIRLLKNEETQEQYYVSTRLGNACLSSSMPPTDGLILFAELQKSRRCFVLESELHAIYLVTPYSVCYQLQDLDWLLYLDLWEKLTPPMKRVGELVGVKESFLVRAMRGQTKLDYKLMQIHKRFYTALALQELVNEIPINVVALKYRCTRGMLQSLQQMSSSFAGIVTSFCNSLKWYTLSLIVSQFKERLYFGIHRDLIDLMRLTDLNQKRARVLFDAGITSLVQLANADILCIEKILYNALSFDSVKNYEHENDLEAAQRNKARNFVITGKPALTVSDAAKLFVFEARKILQYDIGVGNIKWSQTNSVQNQKYINGNSEMHMSYENKYENDITKCNVRCTTDHLKHKENTCQGNCLHEIEKSIETLNITRDISKPLENNIDDSQNIRKQSSITKEDLYLTLSTEKPRKNIYLGNNLGAKNIEFTTELHSVVHCKKNNYYRDVRKIYNNKDICESYENEVRDDIEKSSGAKKTDFPTINLKSLKNSNANLDFAKSPRDEFVGEPITIEGKSITSKRDQGLLKANQLSEIKKKRWTNVRDLEQNKVMNRLEIKTTTFNNIREIHKNVDENINISNKSADRKISANTPKAISIKDQGSEELLSTRHHDSLNTIEEQNKLKSKKNEKISNNALSEDGELDTISTLIKGTLTAAPSFEELHIPKYKEMNSPEEEIPSSQRVIEDMPDRRLQTPQSARLLRSLHIQKFRNSKNVLEIPLHYSLDVSDFSVEMSLMNHPIQLNASHILSCSRFDSDSSSFKSLDILDICGDEQLFKRAFKEFMACKRLGFSLGIQKQCGNRIPIIGSNLLVNQGAGSETENELSKSYDFQIDDTNYLAGIAFCISENVVYYMNMQREGSCTGLSAELKMKYLRMLLRSSDHTLIVYEGKEQMKVLHKILNGIGKILTAFEDPKVANWLLQPDKNHNLCNLAHQFAPECSSLVNLCGGGRGYYSYGLDSDSAVLAKFRASIEACVILHILKGQRENLERIGHGQLQKFFTELEMPMQMSLCNMELIGFPTSSGELHKLLQQMVDTKKKIENKIYEMHGSKFNLASSSAVARVLGLHRKSNGRISTSKQILEKIDSPISQLIIIYRKISASLTKSIQPLLQCVKNERIHGQSITFTATGRISMNEPNLQNVAKDFDAIIDAEKITISCRSAFLPADTKSCLISSDFCQLEMRILAHLSQDSALLHVIKSDEDFFVAIAARWNKIPEDSVTEQLRNGTKQICYSIVYGMGIRALAEALKCTEQEAKLVSEQFHAAYPGIKSYTEKVIEFAKSNGYIETITGRRRYFENISSEDRLIRNQAERQAVNSTIQGSAADIVKNAILRIEKSIIKYHEKLGLEPDSVRLVLHLHDELIYEVPEEKCKKVAKVISRTMENCVTLKVPLKVKIKIGKSWGELKEVKL